MDILEYLREYCKEKTFESINLAKIADVLPLKSKKKIEWSTINTDWHF